MPSRRNTIRTYFLLAASLAPLPIVGCAQKKVQAVVPAPAPPPATHARPMTVAPDTDVTPPLEAAEVPPEIPQTSPSEIVNLAPAPVIPAPRRNPERGPVETAEQDNSSRPAPKIAPELSPTDQAAKQKQIEDDSAVANRNLQLVQDRQLSPTQQDLKEKVGEFLSEATLATKNGDWVRAQNLAHRARLLSESLVNP